MNIGRLSAVLMLGLVLALPAARVMAQTGPGVDITDPGEIIVDKSFETVPVPGDGQNQWFLDSGAMIDDAPAGFPILEDDPHAGYSGLRLRLPTPPIQ